MAKRILIIQGHPDPTSSHFCHALSQAYTDAARDAGHAVQHVEVATLDFPLLRSKHEWEQGDVPASLQPAQQAILWSEHLVFFFPLWLGGMPALLKGFLEQIARPGFALSTADEGRFPKKLLTGRSARLVVTMGMPALVYRWVFRAHSVKALERNILGFVGIGPIHETLIGNIEGDAEARTRWLARLRALGESAE
ncbi:MAG TPA: NAD(P)H-dependent oxidoreductase [Burkholderiaceae bacterium]|nr:NAD(P)H-dependent oxidoreductase [Burkholderiaceae bacterium]